MSNHVDDDEQQPYRSYTDIGNPTFTFTIGPDGFLHVSNAMGSTSFFDVETMRANERLRQRAQRGVDEAARRVHDRAGASPGLDAETVHDALQRLNERYRTTDSGGRVIPEPVAPTCSSCRRTAERTPQGKLWARVDGVINCKDCADRYIRERDAEKAREAERRRQAEERLRRAREQAEANARAARERAERARWDWIETAFRSVPQAMRASLYRNLSRTLHPDTGGDAAAMQILNAVKERYP